MTMHWEQPITTRMVPARRQQHRRRRGLSCHSTFSTSLRGLVFYYYCCCWAITIITTTINVTTVRAQTVTEATTTSTITPVSDTMFRTVCYTALNASNVNQDSRLERDEYAVAVHTMALGTLQSQSTTTTTPRYNDLSSILQNVFTKHAVYDDDEEDNDANRMMIALEDPPAMNGLCYDIVEGILVTLQGDGGVVQSFSRCFLFLSINDRNRNDALTWDEFGDFLNSFGKAMYGISSLEEATNVETVLAAKEGLFQDFTIENAINITGTSPTSDTMTLEQRFALQSLCLQSSLLLSAVTPATDIQPTAPTSAPETPLPDFSFRLCRVAMAVADMNRNDELDGKEYVRLLNTLFPPHEYSRFDTVDFLPRVLRDNFYANVVSQQPQLSQQVWDIQGARPGVGTTPDEEINLLNLCNATRVALQAVKEFPIVPTPAPAPTIPFVRCFISIVTSDVDRSLSLSPEEYVAFLNLVTSSAWRNYTFSQLPEILQTNFIQLASASNDTDIAIGGEFPSAALTPTQRAFIERICSDTATAISEALNSDPTSPRPTPSPSFPSQTHSPAPPGRLSIQELVAQTFALSILERFFGVSQLFDELSKEGPFTLFCPWNYAWRNLPPEWVAKLQDPSWNAHLRDMLLYHAHSGKLSTEGLPGAQTLTMQNSEAVVVTRTTGTQRIRVNDILVLAEYDARDGTAYMLEEVLLPPWFGQSLLEILKVSTSPASMFAKVLVGSDMESLLNEPSGNLTVLVPSDEAFARIGEAGLDYLFSEDGEEFLEATLRYHVIDEGPYPFTYFTSTIGGTLQTLAGKTISLSEDDPYDLIGDLNNATILVTDQLASNGLFHIVDSVLLLGPLPVD